MALWLLFVFSGIVVAQPTRLDLGTQAKNVDFTLAESTKPFRTGSALPSTCVAGEAFFRLNVTTGSNLYGCTSTNIWELLGGGNGSGNMALSTGAGSPTSGCIPGADWWQDTTTVPRTLWYCSQSGVWRKILDTSGVGPFVVTGESAPVPAVPAAGFGAAWMDATDKVWKSIDDAGAIATTVRPGGCAPNGGYLKGIDATGLPGCGGDAATSAYQRWEFEDGAFSGWTVSTLAGGGTGSWIAAEANHPGLVRIQTSASGTSDVYLLSKSSPYTSNPMDPAEAFSGVYLFRVNGTQPDTAQTIRVGLMGDFAAQPGNGIYLEKLVADTEWFGVTRAGAAQTRSASVGSVTNGWTALAIRRVDGTTVGFRVAASISGLSAATEQTLTSTVPAASLFPAFVMVNGSGAVRSMDIDVVDHLVAGMSR